MDDVGSSTLNPVANLSAHPLSIQSQGGRIQLNHSANFAEIGTAMAV
jgi:hypothetical protein